jgi:hypothetical protein
MRRNQIAQKNIRKNFVHVYIVLLISLDNFERLGLTNYFCFSQLSYSAHYSECFFIPFTENEGVPRRIFWSIELKFVFYKMGTILRHFFCGLRLATVIGMNTVRLTEEGLEFVGRVGVRPVDVMIDAFKPVHFMPHPHFCKWQIKFTVLLGISGPFDGTELSRYFVHQQTRSPHIVCQ